MSNKPTFLSRLFYFIHNWSENADLKGEKNVENFETSRLINVKVYEADVLHIIVPF